MSSAIVKRSLLNAKRPWGHRFELREIRAGTPLRLPHGLAPVVYNKAVKVGACTYCWKFYTSQGGNQTMFCYGLGPIEKKHEAQGIFING